MSTKMYINRLNRKTTEGALYDMFCSNGVYPLSVEIKKNIVGIDSKGYGFIIVDDNDVSAALMLDGVIIDGREIAVKEATERGYRKPVTMGSRNEDY